MAKIIRILNHNAVLIHEAKENRVLLLLDKGIGFGRKINEQIEPPYTGKVYELQKETTKGPTKDVLNHLEPEFLELSSEIIAMAEGRFKNIDRNILLPLADHIAFAIARIKSGLNITNPFVNDICMLYPEEYEIAKMGKQLIYERCGYEINEDEVGYITLHIHSAMGEQVDEGMLVAVIINESIQQVEKECGVEIDVHTLSYSRLLTHMKYLLARLRDGEILALDMEEYTRTNFPYSYNVAQHIIERIERTIRKEIPKVEIGYLALHIERVCRNDTN